MVLCYALLCALFYNFQEKFFFQPKTLGLQHVFDFPAGMKYLTANIPFDSATVIDVIKFQPDSIKPKGVVLFFHGNRYNVEHYSNYAPYFTAMGYEVWMPDYPGYGRSKGLLTVEILKDITTQLYKMARAKYPASQITVYGKSLGTGLAAYLASVRDCKQVILETPYFSLSSIAKRFAFFLPVKWLMRFEINTNDYVEKISVPITMLHGTADELIPFDNAIRLLNYAKPTDAFYVVKNGTHNTLPKFPLYHHVIDSVLAH